MNQKLRIKKIWPIVLLILEALDFDGMIIREAQKNIKLEKTKKCDTLRLK